MDAIILAAGKGTRLRPHTEATPKPLLPVQGRPILDWIIGALPPVDRLVVVVNYLAEQIEDYLRRQTHVRDWTTVRQAEPRGTGDALMSCKGAVHSDRVMVLSVPVTPEPAVSGPLTGGQKVAHWPEQFDLLDVSGTNQYKVMPLESTSTC